MLPDQKSAVVPSQKVIQKANIFDVMTSLGKRTVQEFHRWTIENYEDFWQIMLDKLRIQFRMPPEAICDLTQGVAKPRWLPGSKLNIIESCFTAPPQETALIYLDENNQLQKMTYAQLDKLSNQIANSLVEQGYQTGDAIAVVMPMNYFAVAIYLGIIKMGGVVVSIADSFSVEEIDTRIKIAGAKLLFTQSFSVWGGKEHPLYEKIKQTEIKKIILIDNSNGQTKLRTTDLGWKNFLVNNEKFHAVACDPMHACNILFSSGTTATPKAIVWNHTTPIKVASDAFFHQDIHAGDILVWPTNLGWMMGPWLIFAGLINHATVGLYTEVPKDRTFGEFVEKTKVTMLGVVPTLVAYWRQTACMEGLDWNAIKVFSSTGECSNANDMQYLMQLANHKPVIEYCGGTEIGGAYLSSTVVENNYPSFFTTPTMGMNIFILDEHGNPATQGEVAICPPSIGLSTTLLNGDHETVYFANMPKTPDGKLLRRHGDEIKFENDLYSILGRVDDTMNLGGIKVSAAEIERSLAGIPGIIEVAAIAVSPPNNGPSCLVIYAVTQEENIDTNDLKKKMQTLINQHLNPLFKIHDICLVAELPKTASNKIVRRELRKRYSCKYLLNR